MNQIKKNIIWNTLGNTAYNGLQWLITVIVTRAMGFDGAGVLSIAMALSLAFRTIAYFGIRSFQVTDNSDKYSIADYMGFRIVTCVLSFVLCAAFAAINGYAAESLTAILLYMLFRVFEGLSDLLHGIMQKNERLDTAGKCLLVKGGITTLFFCIGFFGTKSLNVGLAFMSLSAAAVFFSFELPAASRAANEKIGAAFAGCRRLAAETLPMLIYMAETAVIFNAPKYLLSLMTSEAEVGLYSSVFSLSLPIQAFFQYLYVPYITKFSALEEIGSGREMKKLAVKIVGVFAGAAILFSAAAFIFGSTVLTLIYGFSEQYGSIIIPIILSVCAYSLMTFISTFAVIKRSFKRLIAAFTCGAAVLIAVCVILIPHFGINGASYGLTIASIAAILLMSLRRR